MGESEKINNKTGEVVTLMTLTGILRAVRMEDNGVNQRTGSVSATILVTEAIWIVDWKVRYGNLESGCWLVCAVPCNSVREPVIILGMDFETDLI